MPAPRTLLHAATVVLGDRLGLYAALADGEPTTPDELATRAGILPRYALEWLSAQAAAGYVDDDADTGCFRLPAEHAAVLVEGDSPVFVPGAFLLASSTFRDEPAIAEAYRQGRGFGGHGHHNDLFVGTEKFFRPGYAANLVDTRLPVLDGVTDRLRAGGRVADVGWGWAHPPTSWPRRSLPPRSWARTTTPRPSSSPPPPPPRRPEDFTGTGFDLVTFFDCLHDMGDPAGAVRHVRAALAPEGTWMLVEPMANEHLEDNVKLIGEVARRPR